MHKLVVKYNTILFCLVNSRTDNENRLILVDP